MKNFHQNLLIVLALSLCGLCIYQWNAQTQQRKEINTLNKIVYDKSLAIQDYTNHIAELDGQVAQMSKSITELNSTIKTNLAIEYNLRQEVSKLRSANDILTNQVAQYIKVQETLEGRLKDAYDGIKKRDDAIKELVSQRDEVVQKLNDSVKDRNNVVSNYNDLVIKYNDLVKSTGKQSSK